MLKSEEEVHPLTQAYIECSRLKAKVQELRVQYEMELASIEKQLSSIRRSLRAKYGEGYITVKWVKGKAGKKYHYAIYRIVKPERKDVYLPREVLELVMKARDLKKKVRNARKAEWRISLFMKALDDYAPGRP